MPRLLTLVAPIVLVGGLVLSVAGAPVVTPTRGGTLIVGSGTGPTTLDGHLYADAPTGTIMYHIVETLFDLTPEGKVSPRLALNFTFSPDGKTLTIRLRPGIRFHDGTPFDAEAAKFNLDRILNPATRAPWRFLISPVTQVSVVDSLTIRLATDVPFAPLLAHLTHGGISMQSPATIQRMGADYGRQPVGTGPFRFKEWVLGDRVVVTRNDDYWGDKAFLDEVQFRVIPDDGARLAALEAGSIHVAVRVPPREIERLKTSPVVTVEQTTSFRTIYVAFNVSRPPFNDKRVRLALNYAVNKRAIVASALAGTARVADAPLAPYVAGYSPIVTYEWDLERAEALLREAGYSRARPLRAVFHHPTGRYIRDVEIAASIQGLVRRAGIELELRTLEFGAYVALARRPKDQNDLQMFMLGWGAVTGDADYGLYSVFHSSQFPPVGFNLGFYQNPRVDVLLDRGRSAVAQAERDGIYAEAMKIVMEDVPWLFLHIESQVTGIRKAVQDLVVHPAERIMASKAWLRR